MSAVFNDAPDTRPTRAIGRMMLAIVFLLLWIPMREADALYRLIQRSYRTPPEGGAQ